MAYTRFGEGAKTLLWIPDPSHAGHSGQYPRFRARVVRPFADAGYSVFLVLAPTGTRTCPKRSIGRLPA